MNNIQSVRIIKYEFEEISRNPLVDIGVTVGLNNEDIFEWNLTLKGPENSNYKKGIYYLRAKFPKDYPESPPEITFITPIYHLNVNSKYKQGVPLGQIYLKSLIYWKREYNMKKILPEIFVLLLNNNPECGYDSERNKEFQYKRAMFEEKVKYFNKKYAMLSFNSKMINYQSEWNFDYPEN